MSLKQDLLKAGRKILASGMVAGTWGNLSAWDQEREGFWITPSGMDYLTLTEDDLVLLNREGQVLSGTRKPSSEYMLHAHIYEQRPDVKGIIHTHSVYATAHAVTRTEIPAVVEDLAQIVGGAVATASYESPGTRELGIAAVRALGNKSAVLLANHGLVGVGPNLTEALKVCQIVEKAAQINLLARLIGTPVSLDQEDIAKMRYSYLHSYGQR
ncbi:class II aldolase/adducin family protein [Paradesulfitobacterium aromaticivorans]